MLFRSVRERFSILSKVLNKLNLPYFCEFVYVDEGIIVNGKTFPTTRMRWVNGVQLNDYILEHKNNGEKLKKLADSFLKMCIDMHSSKIAHGDLQHGNILVNEDGRLFLVDYDSMYCEEMQNVPDIIAGKEDYQHPKRKNNNYASIKLDYFSELIIYLSIIAIWHKPQLIEHFDISDSLLFKAADFVNIEQSKIYKELDALGNDFKLYLIILKEYLSINNINTLESFDLVIDRLSRKPVINSFDCRQGDTIYKGDCISLHWDIEYYTELYINDKKIDKNNYSTSLSSTSTFTITAINGLKQTKKNIEIKVISKPTISFKSSQRKIKPNSDAILSWNIKNANSAVLKYNGESEKICLLDSKIISPLCSIQYQLEVIGLDGKKIFNKELVIDVVPEAVIEFYADKRFTLPNVPIVLNWNVQNAKSIELVGDFAGAGIVKTTGSLIVELTKDSRIILMVKDEFGIKEAFIDFFMVPLPQITQIEVPIQHININMNIINSVPQYTKNIDIQLPEINIPKVTVVNENYLIEPFSSISLQPPINIKHKMKPKGKWFTTVMKAVKKYIIND